MKLQQLRYIAEVAQRELNVTSAAEHLFTSQPGVSKQIRLLEDELGVEVFQRSGKHLTAITPAGEQILNVANDILRRVEAIEGIAAEARDENTGSIRIATTHTQARYALPDPISRFRKRYPKVSLHIQQGSPKQIAQWAARGEVDFCIATEAMELFDDLVMMPCYHWNRCVLVPSDHPLTTRPLSLTAVGAYPIITYVFGFTGRSKLDEAFAAKGLKPDIVLTAVDADVIKTYVRLGLGVGIVANMAYDADADKGIVALEADHLFKPSTTRIGFRRGTWLRKYMFDFIEIFAPHLSQDLVERCNELKTPEERAAQFSDINDRLPRF